MANQNSEVQSTATTACARVTKEERLILETAADMKGTNLSDWLRTVCLREAKRELKSTTLADIEAQAKVAHDKIDADKERKIQILNKFQSS
jgi:uncharacterized protein (DUF1778 family)